jgi:hypothetical protein
MLTAHVNQSGSVLLEDDIITAMEADPELAAAVDIIGIHASVRPVAVSTSQA